MDHEVDNKPYTTIFLKQRTFYGEGGLSLTRLGLSVENISVTCMIISRMKWQITLEYSSQNESSIG